MNSITKNRIVRALSLAGFRARILVAVALAGVITSSCDVHGISGVGTLASITVRPNATLAPNGTQQMVAEGRDADGRIVVVSPVWSVVGGGGTINAAGLFTAGSTTGLFPNTVKATLSDLSGNASITVIPGPLATIVVTPNPVTMAVTTTQQFIAVGKDAQGNVVNLSHTWSVVAGGGTIDQNGVFTAGGTPGTYANTVQASSGGLTGTATVTVTAGPLATLTVTPNPATLIVGARQQFVAVGKDASNNILPIVATWSVVAGGGTIDGGGLFTAGAQPATFPNTVKATSGTLSATATVIVTAGPLAFITVTPNPAIMAVNTTAQLTAVGTDIAGNVVAITPTWAVVTTSNGASITQTGLYTSGTVTGTFVNKVRATSGIIAGFATIIVTAGPLATLTVTPNPVFMPTSSLQQFVAVGTDASGNIVPFTGTWSVVNGGGIIDVNTGLFTSGGASGTFISTIKATSVPIAGVSISGFATVTVNAPIVPPPPPPPSPLGAAADYGILAGAGISCAISGSVTGATGAANIGTSPTLTISGFPVTCTYSGIVPLPAVVATAKGALTVAYLAAQSQVCDLDLSGIDLGFYDGSTPAKTLAGDKTYCFSSSAALTGTLKLTGNALTKWTFRIVSTLNAEVGSIVTMAGGAIPDNVYWAVGSSATLKTNAQFKGNIMSFASISLQNGVILNGRALAQTGAVDMTPGAASIIKP